MTEDYQKFFDLREKYPKDVKLISELMAFYFLNGDSFSKTIYLPGKFNEENVSTIFGEFNLSNVYSETLSLRGSILTIVFTN